MLHEKAALLRQLPNRTERVGAKIRRKGILFLSAFGVCHQEWMKLTGYEPSCEGPIVPEVGSEEEESAPRLEYTFEFAVNGERILQMLHYTDRHHKV